MKTILFRENVHDTGYLDQKDDLEGTLALISNLDLVLSPASSPSMMSVYGIPSIIYAMGDVHWFGRRGKFTNTPSIKTQKCITPLTHQKTQNW